MMYLTIILGAMLLMPLLLYYEKKKNRKGLLPTKAFLSSLFVLAALVQPHPIPGYYHLLLIGLILCLGGDLFLALPQEKMFLLGLLSFLIGHIFYILAFFHISQTGRLTLVGSLIFLIISGGICFWLWSRLGSMKGPVLLYVVVITVMVSGAFSVLGGFHLARGGRVLVFAGALLFYFSDVFVARDRFVKNEFINRLIGLPMYYTGQFLIAFSVGLLKH
ncbi:MAG: lysoplasmalogenase [Pseudomonadota bacterium]